MAAIETRMHTDKRISQKLLVNQTSINVNKYISNEKSVKKRKKDWIHGIK